jgi:UDP-N-acetylglucosamine--N-acetylmuramyl-(pentapeptide) pyrophosphoryl-undecaprenol N-acetylglucosamine transferase
LIFATVGSHPTFEFDRFLRALEPLGGDENLVVQYGPGTPPANARLAVPWMSFAEIVEHMERASHVVSHAGVGTILCAVQAGHVPIVLPRLRRFSETVDDHQLGLASALARTGRVVLAEDAALLSDLIRETPARGKAAALGGGELVAAVRRELLEAVPPTD